MGLVLKIAKRYLISKKSTNAINIISSVSMIGVMVGTMSLIVVLSVFNGFEDLVLSLYKSFDPDIKITAATGKTFELNEKQLNKLRNLPNVKTYSKVLEENASLVYGEKRFIATVKGVDKNFTDINHLDSTLIRGKYSLKDEETHHAVIGAGIEAALGINIEDMFRPITAYVVRRDVKNPSMNPVEAISGLPAYPVGVFSIQQEFDLKYMVVSLDYARELLNYKNEISALEIGLKNSKNSQETQEQIQEILGNQFVVKNRYEQNDFLYKVMKTEKWAVYFILTFILIIAAFNIIGSLSMLVIEKQKDISILKAMGADKGLIKRVFLASGCLIAFAGSALGMILATLLCLAQQQFKIIKLPGSGSFVIDAYPVSMRFSDFILVMVTVIVISLVASWLPASRAANRMGLLRGR